MRHVPAKDNFTMYRNGRLPYFTDILYFNNFIPLFMSLLFFISIITGRSFPAGSVKI
jgi:hypothetical protein